jgi:hypothetical protein
MAIKSQESKRMSGLQEQKLETEEWRSVRGYTGFYLVSSLGRVQGILRGTILKPDESGKRSNPKKYWRVTLSKNGKTRRFGIHQLVARAFVGPQPKGKFPNHKDGDKKNNRATNLEWLTHQENMDHAKANGLIPRIFHILIETRINILDMYATGDYSTHDLGKIFQVSASSVKQILKRAKEQIGREVPYAIIASHTSRSFRENAAARKAAAEYSSRRHDGSNVPHIP